MAFTTIPGSGAAATTIVGTSGVDFGSITSVDNYFVGAQQGGDTIGVTANLTNGTMKGGQGNDTVSFTAGATLTSSFLNANSNNDTIGNAAGNANFFTSTVLGGQGNDTVQIGTVNTSRVNGNKGNDTIASVTTATATLYGGQGNDTVQSAASATSLVSGDLGNDQIIIGGGNQTNSTINGGDGSDRVTINASTAATNTFTSNTINGGAGNDTIQTNGVRALSSGTVVNGDAGIDTINLAVFTQAVTINGGADGDILTSGLAADVVTGGAGNDVITNTNIAAGTSNDTITAGTGADNLTLSVNSLEDLVQASGDSIAATVGFSQTVTTNGTTIVFGNGVDIVNTALQVGGTIATSDNVATGIAGGTELGAGSNITALAAGNYVINGAWAAATQTFTANTGGADALFFQTAGGDAQTTAGVGTMSMILIGSGAGGGGTDVGNQMASTFIV